MRRSLFLFYFLFFYALAQLIWWGVLIARAVPDKKEMIIGEGIFFLVIFFVFSWRLKGAVVRDYKMQQQQRNFLLAVTHELKSPLASIKLYLQTMLKRSLTKEQKEQFIANSLKDIERLDYLVENVLLATKLESAHTHFQKDEVNLTDLIAQVCEQLQVNACTSQTIQTELQPEVYVYADRFAMTNVITNLVENAVKYSPANESIQVKLWLSEDKDMVHFSVADNGIGIEAEEKKRIFNKFYRVGQEATRKTKGTGLGLYIVKTVLERHEGQIKVKDNVPNGTVFEVTLKNYATK